MDFSCTTPESRQVTITLSAEEPTGRRTLCTLLFPLRSLLGAIFYPLDVAENVTRDGDK